MTYIPSIVRLVPVTNNGQWDSNSFRYEAQYIDLKTDEPWITVGILIFNANNYHWQPCKDHESDFSSIDDITIQYLYKEYEYKFDPKLYARYKIRKFANEILEHKWPLHTIIPPKINEIKGRRDD